LTSRPRTEERKRRPERVSRPAEAGRPAVLNRDQLAEEDSYLPVMDRARCFQRHPSLGPECEDLRCEHCAKFLTIQCAHIDLFIDDVENLDEE
jgi:hypothetical protein